MSVWNRTPERAEALARDLGVRAVSEPEPADLLVNCTSVGLERGLPHPAEGGRPRAASRSSAPKTPTGWPSSG